MALLRVASFVTEIVLKACVSFQYTCEILSSSSNYFSIHMANNLIQFLHLSHKNDVLISLFGHLSTTVCLVVLCINVMLLIENVTNNYCKIAVFEKAR